MLTENEELEYLSLLEQDYIHNASVDFWTFCNILSPDFYLPERKHLVKICDDLQALYEHRLLKPDGTHYRNFILEVPPRHGKSRTLTNFSAWCLGRSHTNKIITISFNDELAQDFSKFTRDIIMEQKNLPDQVVYSDIFDAKIKHGDAAAHKWALEGQFFNYKGAGIQGNITGRGGNIIIIDDPIKDAETAYNEYALEKIWMWYTGTFFSRPEKGAITIICMTPWSKNDLGARAVASEPENWYKLSLPAYDGVNMLCPDILDYDGYTRIKSIGDPNIISANYDMQRLDVKGRLYSGFKTYTEIPTDTDGNIGYTDTADEGSDYLCSIQARRQKMYLYVTDVLYTTEAQEVTEPLLAGIIQNEGTKDQLIESNNGGRGFARNVQRILDERGCRARVKWFHQSKNKKARILTSASSVQEYVLFPEDWKTRWPEFYRDIMTYQKEGKNKHDDAPDVLSALVEHFGTSNKMHVPEVSFDGAF